MFEKIVWCIITSTSTKQMTVENPQSQLDQIASSHTRGIMELAHTGKLAGYGYNELFGYFQEFGHGDNWARANAHHLRYSINMLDNVAKMHTGETDWSVFNDFRILDLGCGGNEGFYPWLVGMAGFADFREVVGVDIAKQREELQGVYTHINQDLVALLPNTPLSALQNTGGSFDIVSCMTLLTDVPSNVLKQALNRTGFFIDDMRVAVKANAQELLAPGGIAYLEFGRHVPWYYMKTDKGELAPMEVTENGLELV